MEIVIKPDVKSVLVTTKESGAAHLGRLTGMPMLEGRIPDNAYKKLKQDLMMLHSSAACSEICLLSNINKSALNVAGVFATKDEKIITVLELKDGANIINYCSKYDVKSNTLYTTNSEDVLELVDAVSIFFGNYFNPKYKELVLKCFDTFTKETIKEQMTSAAITTSLCFLSIKDEWATTPFVVEDYAEEDMLSEEVVTDFTELYGHKSNLNNEIIQHFKKDSLAAYKVVKPKALTLTDVTLDLSEQTEEEKQMVDDLRDTLINYIASPEDKFMVKRLADGGLGAQGLLMVGGPGTGKTEAAKYMSTQLGVPLIPLVCAQSMDLETFFGYVGIESKIEDGQVLTNTKMATGPVTEAIKKGYVLLLDEINALPEDTVTAINGLIGSNSRYFVIPKSGEKIMIHPNFRLIGTLNHGTQYVGTSDMNPATLSRCIIYQKELMKVDVIKQIIRGSYCKSYDAAIATSNIIDVAAEMYISLSDVLAQFETDTVISTRNCVMLVDFYLLTMSTNPGFAKDRAFIKACDYSVLPHLTLQDNSALGSITDTINQYSRRLK